MTNDGSASSGTAIVILNVASAADAPAFTANPNYAATASVGSAYSGSIAGIASDPDGTTPTYTKLNGPSWLTVSSNGTLGGTPTIANFGINSWTIRARDNTGLRSTATLEIRVTEGSVSPLSFANLTTGETGNLLTTGNGSNGLTVTRAADGNDFLFSVRYTGDDFNGDRSNDTLTYDVRVSGWSGGAVDLGDLVGGVSNLASATIGTTDSQVGSAGSAFFVGDSFMNTGESLEYSVENAAVALSGGNGSGLAFSTGFSSARLQQTSSTGNGHQVVFGSGTRLLGVDFPTNYEPEMLAVGRGSLYISSNQSAGTRSTHWGVANVDYGMEVTVVPEGSYSEWAFSFGLSDVNPSIDSDGDGVSNLSEFENGTNPTGVDSQTNATSDPGIRVTEYYLTAGDFSGTSATVTLDQDLADDYFILVRGSRSGNASSLPDSDYARVTGVPFGNDRYSGELVGGQRRELIAITRSAAAQDWEGVVTVVECTNPDSANGFRLVDILSVNLSGNSGSERGNAWDDIGQVVLFGGYRGGGVSYVGTPTSGYDNASAASRFFPSGSDTIEWTRNSGGENLLDVTATTFVVEWGSAWNVQHRLVTGNNGGNGANATGEYTAVPIDPVSRDNTWVWGTGTRLDSGVGDGTEGCLVTLGNGVAQTATESVVSVGSEYTDTYWFDVYAMTHPDLQVDYRFKADGNRVDTDVAVTVDSAPSGARFGWVYNGCNGTGSSVSRAKFWSRYTGDNEITMSRGNSSQNFPAWIQGIDFSGLNN